MSSGNRVGSHPEAQGSPGRDGPGPRRQPGILEHFIDDFARLAFSDKLVKANRISGSSLPACDFFARTKPSSAGFKGDLRTSISYPPSPP
jgi:hypothetical protein